MGRGSTPRSRARPDTDPLESLPRHECVVSYSRRTINPTPDSGLLSLGLMCVFPHRYRCAIKGSCMPCLRSAISRAISCSFGPRLEPSDHNTASNQLQDKASPSSLYSKSSWIPKSRGLTIRCPSQTPLRKASRSLWPRRRIPRLSASFV